MNAIAENAAQILEDAHGPKPWHKQLLDMLKEALQNGIEHLSKGGPIENATPFRTGEPVRTYAMPARTGPEALAEMAAEQRDIGRAPRPQRQRVANQVFDRGDRDTFAEREGVADPMANQPAPTSPKAENEWLL